MIRNAYLIHQWPYALSTVQLDGMMTWIANHGFNAVSIAVNEMDFEKNANNLKHVFQAAKRQGLAVHAVPSRWGGMVAGVPGVHSGFCIDRPDCCARDVHGETLVSPIWGYTASVYAQGTKEQFTKWLIQLFELCPFDGLIWDEPKNFYFTDYSSAALSSRPAYTEMEYEYGRVASFYDEINIIARTIHPDIYISMFVYADSEPPVIEAISRIRTLNSFGIDGNPFIPQRMTDKRRKTLIGTLNRVKALALPQGKDSMALIENFGISIEENILMEEQLKDVLAVRPEHLLAYYYGRNNEDPERTMDLIGRAFSRLAAADMQ